MARGYQEVGLVMVLLDQGQTLGHELSFHFLTTNDNLHPGLQVKNAAIGLHAMRNRRMLWFFSDWKNKCGRDAVPWSSPAGCESIQGCWIVTECLSSCQKPLLEF